jgi:hypothetical protein
MQYFIELLQLPAAYCAASGTVIVVHFVGWQTTGSKSDVIFVEKDTLSVEQRVHYKRETKSGGGDVNE